MIALIKGEIFTVNNDSFIIMTGGVGLRVYAPVNNFDPLPRPSDEIMLYTYHQVKEDAMLLFGFESEMELALFELLISVNGVGAKTALLMLNNLSFQQICQSILTGNSQTLSKTPGIGKKTADRIILELTDKIRQAGWFAPSAGEEPVVEELNPNHRNLAVSALSQLGYSTAQATAMVSTAASALAADCTVEELIAAALRSAN